MRCRRSRRGIGARSRVRKRDGTFMTVEHDALIIKRLGYYMNIPVTRREANALIDEGTETRAAKGIAFSRL